MPTKIDRSKKNFIKENKAFVQHSQGPEKLGQMS